MLLLYRIIINVFVYKCFILFSLSPSFFLVTLVSIITTLRFAQLLFIARSMASRCSSTGSGLSGKVTSRYHQLEFLRLVVILPWFAFLPPPSPLHLCWREECVTFPIVCNRKRTINLSVSVKKCIVINQIYYQKCVLPDFLYV